MTPLENCFRSWACEMPPAEPWLRRVCGAAAPSQTEKVIGRRASP
jgi:hypothetical protein